MIEYVPDQAAGVRGLLRRVSRLNPQGDVKPTIQLVISPWEHGLVIDCGGYGTTQTHRDHPQDTLDDMIFDLLGQHGVKREDVLLELAFNTEDE